MGHEHSKLSSSSSNSEKKGSRRARFKQRLHFQRRTRSGSNGSSSAHKLLSHDNFTGIALFTLLRAEMQFKDKWIACISLGEQTFRTKSSEQTDKPVWNSEKKFLLEQNGPHVARISVFEVEVIQTKSAQAIPFYSSFPQTLKATMWIVYGAFIVDIRIFIPHVLGFISGVGQMVLYAIYRNGDR